MAQNTRILVASAKGGVGKSTTSLSLALAFAKHGKTVLLIDADYQSRSLDVLCDSEGAHLYNLGDVILGRTSSLSAVYKPIEGEENLMFCSAPHSFMENECVRMHGKGLLEMLPEVIPVMSDECGCDITIIDTSSGDGAILAGSMKSFITTAIITSEQSRTSVRAAEYTSVMMEKYGVDNRRLVVCSFDVKSTLKGDRAGVIKLIDESSLVCLGVVPYDKRLMLRQDKGLLPDSKCISFKAYENIASRLEGHPVKLFENITKIKKKRLKLY